MAQCHCAQRTLPARRGRYNHGAPQSCAGGGAGAGRGCGVLARQGLSLGGPGL
ncbi:hypothetical protein [Komagataeibacter xylinus]|uniref:hypothetical protein n=1 Tax=Komagataeibacter xylinus TaxID=28448 RepID=UPI0013EEBCCD|nr:hypothetical protein [Komagataeibacter xylinus]